MIPAIWKGDPRQSSAVIGIASAMGAVGGFLIPLSFGAPWIHDPVTAVRAPRSGLHRLLRRVPGRHLGRSTSAGPPSPGSRAWPTRGSRDDPSTHCPYCALQCGMRLTEGRRAPQVSAWEEFPVNQGALCQQGLERRRPGAGTASASRRRWCATGRAASCGRRRGTRRSTWSRAGCPRCARDRGPDAVAVFGGGGLTNEKAYQLGKFARVALGTANIDYNGRFCMSSAAAAGNAGLRRRPRAAVPAGGPREGRRGAAGRRQPGRDDAAAACATSTRSASAAAGRRGRSAPHAHRGRRRPACSSRSPAPTCALADGLLHVLVAERPGRRGVRRRAHHRLRRRTPLGGRVLARTGRARHRRGRRRDARARSRAARGRPAMVLTARGAEQHSQGTDTVLACINLALALGLRPGRTGGYGCLTGQGNGQGGREHGQKADQLPGYRRIDDPAAREHVAGCGACRRERLPGRGPLGLRAARRARPPRRPARAARLRHATRRSRRPEPPTSSSGSRRSTCWWSPTSSCRRPPRSPTSCCRSRSGPRRRAR